MGSLTVAFMTRDGAFHQHLDKAIDHAVMLDIGDRLKLPRTQVIEWLQRYGSPREWLDAMLQEVIEGEAVHKKVRDDFEALQNVTLNPATPDASEDDEPAP